MVTKLLEDKCKNIDKMTVSADKDKMQKGDILSTEVKNNQDILKFLQAVKDGKAVADENKPTKEEAIQKLDKTYTDVVLKADDGKDSKEKKVTEDQIKTR